MTFTHNDSNITYTCFSFSFIIKLGAMPNFSSNWSCNNSKYRTFTID